MGEDMKYTFILSVLLLNTTYVISMDSPILYATLAEKKQEEAKLNSQIQGLQSRLFFIKNAQTNDNSSLKTTWIDQYPDTDIEEFYKGLKQEETRLNREIYLLQTSREIILHDTEGIEKYLDKPQKESPLPND